MNVDEFTHEDGRGCLRVGRSLTWFYDGGSEKGDVCKRSHGKSKAPNREAEGFTVDRGPRGNREGSPTIAEDVHVVSTPRGSTERFDRRAIELMELLGLIQHRSDGYAIVDTKGNGCGPLHRYYEPVNVARAYLGAGLPVEER